MATSQDYLQQIASLGEMPDFKKQAVQAYQDPVLNPLINERAGLESQYLTSLFEPFMNMGTGASDMSPAAKLAGIGGSLGRLFSRIGANQNIQDYYGTQIDNMANTQSNQYMAKYQQLRDLFDMSSQQEARSAANAPFDWTFGGALSAEDSVPTPTIRTGALAGLQSALTPKIKQAAAPAVQGNQAPANVQLPSSIQKPNIQQILNSYSNRMFQ